MIQDRIATSANRVFLASILLWLLLYQAFMMITRQITEQWYWIINLLIYMPSVVGFGLPCFFFIVKNKVPLWREIYVGKMQLLRSACLGLFVSLASLPLTMLNLRIITLFGFSIPQGSSRVPGLSLTTYITGLIFLAVFPAIIEETLFRGILQRANEPRLGKYSAVYAGVAFALMHFDPYRLFMLIGIGVLTGYMVYYTRSLLMAMVFHFVNNAVALTLQFFLSSINDEVYDIFIENNPTGNNVFMMLAVSIVALIIFVVIWRQVIYYADIRNKALNVSRNELNAEQPDSLDALKKADAQENALEQGLVRVEFLPEHLQGDDIEEPPNDAFSKNEAKVKARAILLSRVKYGAYIAAIFIEIAFTIISNIQNFL